MKPVMPFKTLVAIASALTLSIAYGCLDTSKERNISDSPAVTESNQPETETARLDIAPELKPAHSYLTNLSLLTDTMEEAYGLIGKHLDDYPNETDVRMRTYGTWDLRALTPDELEDYLPHGIFRHRLSVSTRSGEPSLTLEEELDQLAEEYKQQMIENAPDTTLATTLDNVLPAENGVIVDGDQFIDATTIQGALEIEMLNAVAQGIEIGSALNSIQELSSDFEFEFEEDDQSEVIESRYLYKTDLRRWPNGEIVYHYGHLTEAHKSALRTAMSEWQIRTSGAVRFTRYADKSGWYKFQAKLGLKGMVTYESTDILFSDVPGAYTGVAGWSRAGSYGWDRVLMNKNRGWDEYESVLRTARHELGHVIGLKHEHQHWDRDNWVEVPSLGWGNAANYALNYTKIDQYQNVLQKIWKPRKVRIKRGWFRFTIWVPWWVNVFTKVDNAYSGGFDCQSVMLYRLKAKRACPPFTVGEYIENQEISQGDVAGAMRIY